MLHKPIYLDNHATTPTDSRVLEAMLPYFNVLFGNAASSHVFGRSAAQAVEEARTTIARCIGARDAKEILFTSGATESDNLAIRGVAQAYAEKGNHLITCQTEHKAVLNACKRLEGEGFRVTYLGVNCEGLIDLEELADAITEKTILVSIGAANSEIGVIQDMEAIGRICRERGVLLHSDATQAVGKVPFDVQAMNVDLASFTAHKIYGPKGVGALYYRRKNPFVRLIPQTDGGGQENGLRSGTLNVPGIVGLAKALEVCVEDQEVESRRLRMLRERLKNGLRNALDGIYVNGHETQRLPGNLNVSFAAVTGESIMMGMPEIAVSGASACASGSASPSYVLKALGLSDERAFSAIRFGIGRFNTEEEIDYTLERVAAVVKRLRRISPIKV